MRQLSCPICATSMTAEVYEGVEVDSCPSGHGTWLDYGEIKKIIQSREQRFDAKTATAAAGLPRPSSRDMARIVLCPVCRAGMPTVNYQGTSNVAINSCDDQHGIWLDKGELEKIQVLMEKWEGELSKNSRHYQRLLSDAKESFDDKFGDKKVPKALGLRDLLQILVDQILSRV